MFSLKPPRHIPTLPHGLPWRPSAGAAGAPQKSSLPTASNAKVFACFDANTGRKTPVCAGVGHRGCSSSSTSQPPALCFWAVKCSAMSSAEKRLIVSWSVIIDWVLFCAL
jgi:hypothetical protein